MISLPEWQVELRSAGLPKSTKATLFALSTFGDWAKGTRIFPGIDRLAEEMGCSVSTIKRDIKLGRESGWIIRVAETNHMPGIADEYELSVPSLVSLVTPSTEDLVSPVTPSLVSPMHGLSVTGDTPSIYGSNHDHLGEPSNSKSREWFRWRRWEGHTDGYWAEDGESCSATERPASPDGYVWLSRHEASQSGYTDKGIEAILGH